MCVHRVVSRTGWMERLTKMIKAESTDFSRIETFNTKDKEEPYHREIWKVFVRCGKWGSTNNLQEFYNIVIPFFFNQTYPGAIAQECRQHDHPLTGYWADGMSGIAGLVRCAARRVGPWRTHKNRPPSLFKTGVRIMFNHTASSNKPASIAPFFAHLMEQGETHCQQYSFSNGEYIFQEGIQDDRVYLIQTGEVEVGYAATRPQWVDMGPYGMIDMEEGGDARSKRSMWRKKTVLGAGECLGEPCCLYNARHHLSARAMGQVHMLSVHGNMLKKLCADNADFAQCVTTLLAQIKHRL